MNLSLRMLIGVFGAVLAPVILTAQTRAMTLDEVVAAGMANSKQVQIAAAKSAAAHAKTGQFKDAFVPVISYTGKYERLSNNITPFSFTLPDGTEQVLNPVILNQYTNRLSLSEPVFTGFRAANTIRAAHFLEQAAQLDAVKDRTEVQLNLLGAALNLYKLQEVRKTFDQSLQAARSRSAEVRNQRDQGMALDNDVMKADLVVARLETARDETDNALAAAQYALAVLTGLPEDTAIRIDSASVFARTPVVAGLNEYLGSTTMRPEVQAANSRALAAGKQVEISQGAYYPLVSLGANLYANNPNQRVFPPEARFKSTWDAGVTLSWNLSNLYTARHSVEEARLNQLQADLTGAQLTDAAKTDITTNYYQLKSARGRIALAEKTVEQADENRRITEVRQVQQVASVSDLLDADAQFLQAQIDAIHARIDAQYAYFKLLKSTGKL